MKNGMSGIPDGGTVLPLVRIAHWREEEGLRRRGELEAQGFSVEYHPVDAGALLGILKAQPPDALIIDLSRSPAQGRDLGVALRIHGSTRRVPLLFVEGETEKVEAVRRVLPDVIFTSWDGVATPLRNVLAQPPLDPVVPKSALAGYSGTPLPKKLGIKEGDQLLLVQAPEGIQDTLGLLPDGVRLVTRFSSRVSLTLWFVRQEVELEAGIEKWASRVGKGGIWILWPKMRSGVPSDLKQAIVRRVGLANGLVDYKIAAVDATWSGLKFSVRRGRV